MSKRFWKNLGLALLILLVIFNVAAFRILQAYIDDRGQGFIRLGVDGIHIKHLTYARDDQRVQLIGMMHIADQEFSQNVVAAIPTEDSIVLLEGITDDRKRSGKALDYRTLARWLGTSFQDKSFDADIHKKHAYLYADVNVEDLSPESRRFVEMLAEEDEWSERFSTVMGDDFDEDAWDRAEASFQAARNRKLLQTFDDVSSKYKTIAIPWGVTHISTFAIEMEKRSYELAESKEVLALSFW